MNRYPECDKECFAVCAHGNCARHCPVNRTDRPLQLGEHAPPADHLRYRLRYLDPASPVPAAEHRDALRAKVDAPKPPTIPHTLGPVTGEVRFIEQREAFIVLYEAASAFLERTEEEAPSGRLHGLTEAAGGRLRQVLEQSAPAYGRALVARAEKLTADQRRETGGQ